MRLLLGNSAPLNAIDGSPGVTYVTIPDSYSLEEGADHGHVRQHLTEASRKARGGYAVTHMPDHEALVAVLHPNGIWANHAVDDGINGRPVPTFVHSPDTPELERFLSEYWDVPAGLPVGLEDDYWTTNGSKMLAPGVSPNAVPNLNALLTNVGRTLWANALGGGPLGLAGTATATTGTTLTSGAVASVTASQYVGMRIYAGACFGNIVSHTTGTTPVFTIDRWYALPETGTAGTTPGSTSTYVISGSSIAAWYVGLTPTAITPAATDTSLSGEATTNGLARKIAPYALTSGTSPATYTLTPVFTYTGSGGTTINAIGVFTSSVIGDTTDTMLFETSLSSSFTVSTSGDQATVTETVTGS